MQINNITPLNKRCLYSTQTRPSKPEAQQPHFAETAGSLGSFSKLPSTQTYLSFTGGYSLNLAETIRNLDKLAEKNPNLYPKNIREWAGIILETGNQAKKTLIDIHKDYYESLKSCPTLEAVKEKFPEFEKVISANDVQFSKNSFGDAVKSGELECFDKDEDLTLQILKLYYGEGFSLNDLKNYADGKDIYHTMKKLEIPRLNRDYGHILKFSDPQYNERLTAEMTYKRRLALDAKARAEGEPVHIPRGPLSQEHKDHISEGLIRAYTENPNLLFEMSERRKAFYLNNPEKSEQLSRVLNKAWNIFGADRIKSALSKFMKSKGFKDFDVESNPVTHTKDQTKTLKQFWATNEWARKSFSKNMEYAWKKVKEEDAYFYTFDITPNGYKRKFFDWAKEKGIDVSNLKFEMVHYPFNKSKSDTDKTYLSTFTRKFADEAKGNEPSKIADSYLYAVLNFNKDISKIDLKKAHPTFKKLIVDLQFTLKDELFGNGFLPASLGKYMLRDLDAQELQRMYSIMAQEAVDKRHPELADLLNKYLNEGYDKIDSGWNPAEEMRLEDYFTD